MDAVIDFCLSTLPCISAHFGARTGGGQEQNSARAARQGAAFGTTQVREQRGREVCHECIQGRAGHAHRRGALRRRGQQCPVQHDAGPVRKLRRPEDDRCGRTRTTQDPHDQGCYLLNKLEKSLKHF